MPVSTIDGRSHLITQTIDVTGPNKIRSSGGAFVAPLTDSFALDENQVAYHDQTGIGDFYYNSGNTTASVVDPNQIGSGFFVDVENPKLTFHSRYVNLKIATYGFANKNVIRKSDNHVIMDIGATFNPKDACEIVEVVAKKFVVDNSGYNYSYFKGFCEWTLKVNKLDDPVELIWRISIPTSDQGSLAYRVTMTATVLLSSWYLQQIHNFDFEPRIFSDQDLIWLYGGDEFEAQDPSLDWIKL